MNIAIDARLLERKMTGIGRFLDTFLKELPSVDINNKYFLFSYEPLKSLNSFYTNIHTGKSVVPQKLYSPYWSNFILPGYLKKYKIDLLFSVNQVIPFVKPRGMKYIPMIHDVIYLVNKSFHPFIYRTYLNLLVRSSIKSSDIILTVSQHSKNDIIKYYNTEEKKIRVVYLSAEKSFVPVPLNDNELNNFKKEIGHPGPYVLYLGMIENRKNIKAILKIADEIASIRPDIKFVMVGKIGYGGKVLANEMKLRQNIIYLQNINDDFLKKLYNISSVFLFPSLYEGFGFPPLEAMQSGLPVLSSDNSSLKEIVDSGGIMHNANDIHAFSKDILRLIEEKDFHREISLKGIEHARKFNINSTVSEIVNIFNSI